MHTLTTIVLLTAGFQDPDLAQMVAAAKLSMPQAAARALAAVGKGALTQAELEFEKDHVVWSFDVAVGDEIEEVLIDAKDGAVVDRDEEDEDCRPVLAAAKKTLLQAVDAAQHAHAGVPIAARLHLVEGKAVVSVKLFADGACKEFDEAVGEGMAPANDVAFTAEFGEDVADLVATGRNPYFVLEPGYALVLEGEEKGVTKRVVIRVLDETRTIAGITARVVEERETAGNELEEVTRDFFAISRRTNSVYYLGEEVDEYEGGKITGHGGSWLHGERGAHYGMMMPGVPLLGARFQQESAPGVGMDRAEIVAVDATFRCPAGEFAHVVRMHETNPLERGSEDKHYAPGVGLLQDGGLKLVRFGKEVVR